MDFLALIQKIGFEDAQLVSETGLNSSPKTKGILLRARKPEPSANCSGYRRNQTDTQRIFQSDISE